MQTASSGGLLEYMGPAPLLSKINFLDELRHLQTIMGNNWVIGGDFNVIRFTHEYSNRSSLTPIMVNFNNFIAFARLIDLSLNNCLYIWSNFRENAIMVKLDRFIIPPN